MPVQTGLKDYIAIPDGAQVLIDDGSGFADVGAISGAVTATLEYDLNKVESANAGVILKSVRNMKITGGFTLQNLNLENISKMGSGLFSLVTTAASPVSTIPDQTIAASWSDNTLYPIIMLTSSSNSTKLKTTTQPVLTSVTLNHGTPEVLIEDTDYVVVADPNSYSGWSFQFISGNMDSASPTTYSITVVFDTNTPVANSTLYCGSSTVSLSSYAMRIKHTDSNSKVRQLDLFSVTNDSGGFQFNFRGANEDGVEEMPLTFTAELDTTLTDTRQLLSFSWENGAI